MAASINRVLLVGNLGRDPELKHTQGGTAVVEFSIAVNSREKVDGEWADRTDWFDIRAWDSLAENCAEYLHKGSKVAVDGRLRVDRWEKEGQKRSAVRIVAQAVQFLDPRSEDGGRPDYGDYAPPAVGAGDAEF